MNVTEAVRKRISTRGFLDKPISKAELTQLLETAQRSPSGGNLQPWKVIAVSVVTVVVFYVVFEKWFKVPLPKGPLESWLGLN